MRQVRAHFGRVWMVVAGLTLATAARAEPPAPTTPPDAGSHERSGPPDAGRERGLDAGAPDAGARDPDQDLVDHLDVIQDMQLLQNLDLFDTAAPKRK